MKKIVLFTDSLGAGGAQRQLVGLAKLLKEANNDITVITYYKSEFYLSFLHDYHIEYVLLENAVEAIKRIKSVIKYIKQVQPDVLIAYQETPSLIACLVKIVCPNIKVIVSERNTTQVIDVKTKIRFFLYRWADQIIPNSYSQERFIKKYKPNLSDKIKTITNFVDIDKFNVQRTTIKNPIPVIMVAATIFNSKNTLGLIEAIKLIKSSPIKFKVKWYGRSEHFSGYCNECENKIREYGLEEYIELLPKTLNIKECYERADYFCLPSFFEGTPNVICEAISCSLPVLCSNVCDNSNYVHEGENGTLFDPNSPQSIADAIIRILSINDKQYMDYSKKSRMIAEEKLSEVIFLKKYQQIIGK